MSRDAAENVFLGGSILDGLFILLRGNSYAGSREERGIFLCCVSRQAIGASEILVT